MLSIWLLVLELTGALACNLKHSFGTIETRINPRTQKCRMLGEECKFDRNCCFGLECTLLDMDNFNMAYVCQISNNDNNLQDFRGRQTWKDYQEEESPEEGDLRNLNTDQLETENRNLKKKLTELRNLRKQVKRDQLSKLKAKLEDAEIDELKEQQRRQGEEFKQDFDRLREKELEEKLLKMERTEVNHTLFKQQRVADLYMNMLADLVDKGGVNKLTI